MDEAVRRVLQPTVDGMRRRGTPYVGVLYAGLMLTDQGLRVLEFNCRFGDPEAQAVLPLLTDDLAASRAFVAGVDSAAVYVNASTRFTDGAEFGMGAEIGISTQKLHARGPIGLRELCTYKYVVQGAGHVRP